LHRATKCRAPCGKQPARARTCGLMPGRSSHRPRQRNSLAHTRGPGSMDSIRRWLPCQSPPPPTTTWAAWRSIRWDAPACGDSGPAARSRTLGSMARTGWPAIRCSRPSSAGDCWVARSAHGPARPLRARARLPGCPRSSNWAWSAGRSGRMCGHSCGTPWARRATTPRCCAPRTRCGACAPTSPATAGCCASGCCWPRPWCARPSSGARAAARTGAATTLAETPCGTGPAPCTPGRMRPPSAQKRPRTPSV